MDGVVGGGGGVDRGGRGERSFGPLLATNFFGTVNDNFLKTLAGFVAIGWLADGRMQSACMGAVAGALVLPYILFSPLADRLTGMFPKRRIVQLAKWAELPIVGVGILGFATHSIALTVGAVLLMGLQSSLYSPSKYALVRDVGGEGRISTGMGWMEGMAFLGVLAGTIAAAFAVDRAPEWVWYGCLGLFAAAGLAASHCIRAEEEPNRTAHPANPLRYLAEAHRAAKAHPGLNSVIFALGAFWWAAATLQMGLLVYGRQALGLDATQTGGMLCGAAAGIVAGQVAAGFIDRRHFLLGASLWTGWVAAGLLLALFFAPMGPKAFSATLAALAFDFGLFKLPLDAEIQKRAKGPLLNTMLAYSNQVSFLFMLAASGCYALTGWAFGPRAFLAVLGGAMAVVPAAFVLTYRKALLFTGRQVLRRRYDVRTEGLEELLAERGKSPWLVLPNHPAMVDPMLVETEFWRKPPRPLVDERFFRAGVLAPLVLRTLEAVTVPDLRAHRSAAGAAAARGLGGIVAGTLAAGGDVIFYPGGHIHTAEGREEIGTRQLAYNACRELPEGVRVVGVRTGGLWGSIWSRKGRKSSPPFVATAVKSVVLWLFWAPFASRRRVTMHVEDLTERVKGWAAGGTRMEFNAKLEGWYNAEPQTDADGAALTLAHARKGHG